jgi:hypothetical protein
VEILTSELMEGRASGSAGGKAAARYIVRCLRQFGLAGTGEERQHIQTFSLGRLHMENVWGLVEGRDPRLKGEVVVVGAHYDHLGVGDFGALDPWTGYGEIHPGADDNASGVAAVLEIARLFGEMAWRPRRSILFLLFGGEEKGLLGSSHYVRHPAFPLSRTAFMLNLDMIGRCHRGRLHVYGATSGLGLPETIKQAGERCGLELVISPWALPGSDHKPFLDRGIPAAFFTTGLHRDYHQASDDAEKIDYRSMERIVRLAFRVIADVADRPRRLHFQPVRYKTTGDILREALCDLLERELDLRNADRWLLRGGILPRSFRPRLGIVPDPSWLRGGVRVAATLRKSPAYHARLRPGDVILALGGKTLRGPFDLWLALRGCPKRTRLLIRRGSKQFRIPITLNGGRPKTFY